ncbi:MAG: folylpolyglutamate synthase/dihydrofolate synthase family protein [Planctomycetota bacterium]
MTEPTSANNAIDSHSSKATNSTDAISLLMGRINYERTTHIPYGERAFKLDRMRDLARRLGNPQAAYPIIHIAGSKGKGSTSTMIASILTSAGYRTGLFTSPHLQRINERIVVDGDEVPSPELDRLVQVVFPVLEQMDAAAEAANRSYDKPTFFEIITALALVHFRDKKVDAAVLEVGLGGRLDSTNICSPIVTAITSIGLDHTRQLGDTHAKIAGEKAGIIKPMVPIVSTVAHPDALQVIRERANDEDSPLWSSECDFDFSYDSRGESKSIDFRLKSTDPDVTSVSYDRLQIAMLGQHQARNAACAVMTTELLKTRGFEITEAQLRAGLASAVCRGRIQVVRNNPVVILDTAHNASSINALVSTLEEEYDLPRESRIVVLAATRGKDVSAILERLMQWAGHLVITKYRENPRGMATDKLTELAEQFEGTHRPEIHVEDCPSTAWQKAKLLADKDSLICITGSFFLAAEVEPLL